MPRHQKAIVLGARRQRPALERFGPQVGEGWLTRRRRWTGVGLVLPGGGLSGQVVIILERPPRQEVAFDPLDQRFNAALLVSRSRLTGLRMKAEVTGKLEQGRGLDRLVGSVTP